MDAFAQQNNYILKDIVQVLENMGQDYIKFAAFGHFSELCQRHDVLSAVERSTRVLLASVHGGRFPRSFVDEVEKSLSSSSCMQWSQDKIMDHVLSIAGCSADAKQRAFVESAEATLPGVFGRLLQVGDRSVPRLCLGLSFLYALPC